MSPVAAQVAWRGSVQGGHDEGVCDDRLRFHAGPYGARTRAGKLRLYSSPNGRLALLVRRRQRTLTEGGHAMPRSASALFLALAVAGAAPSSALAQQCPTGSYPWVDSWGNNICRRHSDGSTATTQVPRNQTCPTGSYSWVDNWGNQICRSHSSRDGRRTDYYYTSKGCPVGTHQTVDAYGNPVCKRF
jgi:hypothetical protein